MTSLLRNKASKLISDFNLVIYGLGWTRLSYGLDLDVIWTIYLLHGLDFIVVVDETTVNQSRMRYTQLQDIACSGNTGSFLQSKCCGRFSWKISTSSRNSI